MTQHITPNDDEDGWDALRERLEALDEAGWLPLDGPETYIRATKHSDTVTREMLEAYVDIRENIVTAEEACSSWTAQDDE